MGLLDYDIDLAKQAIKRAPGLLNEYAGNLNAKLRNSLGLDNARADYAMRNLDAMAGGDLKQARVENNKQLASKMVDLGMNFNPAAVGMVVYHGSPHKFNKFDMSKIGTGEGAQAYGHGLYMAESPEVATSYQKALTMDRGFNFEGQQGLTRDQVQDLANKKYGAKYLDGVTAPSGVADRVIDDIVYGNNGGLPRQYKPDSERAKAYEELRNLIKHTDDGALYKVDIPDEAVARFLDWDKPLSQQAPEVQAALQKAGIDTGVRNAILFPENLGADGFGIRNAKSGNLLSGRFASESEANDFISKQLGFVSPNKNGNHGYEKLEQMFGSQPEATAFLQKNGIPGIRYLDSGSRGAGNGTSNFVLFDDQMPRILEINGTPTGLNPWGKGEWKGLLDDVPQRPLTEFEQRHLTAQKNAALPVEKGGLGLPPDNTAMDRAKAMGFNGSGSHYTTKDFDSFKVGDKGDNAAVWVTTDPSVNLAAHNIGRDGEIAEGANAIPVLFNNSKRVTANDKWANGITSNFPDVVTNLDAEKLKALGFTHGSMGTQAAILDPSNIRSRFAAFDPMRRHEADLLGYADPYLLGTIGGVGLAGTAAYKYGHDK